MEEIVEVQHFDFKKPSRKLLKEAEINPSIIPIEDLVDIYINGQNLLDWDFYSDSKGNPYEMYVGLTVNYFLRQLKYEYKTVRSVELYNCSGCYMCDPIFADVYFYKNFVVWRFPKFWKTNRKVNFIFPLEVYLKGYKTLEGLARRNGYILVEKDTEDFLKQKDKLLKNLSSFWIIKPQKSDLEDLDFYLQEFYRSLNIFRNLVEEVLGFLGLLTGNKESVETAVKFLEIYDPQWFENLSQTIRFWKKRNPEMVLKFVNNTIEIVERALKQCEELVKRKKYYSVERIRI